MSGLAPDEEHEVDAVTAKETATAMSDEQLLDIQNAITGRENMTDVEIAALTEIVTRKLDI